MKKITIYQTDGVKLQLEDDDNSDIIEYTKTISHLLESNNICLVHTSNQSVVIRPNGIKSIVVTDENNVDEHVVENTEQIDIIKD